MNDLEKLLSASENARKIQQKLIRKQEEHIQQLETENNSLKQKFEKLYSDYEKTLTLCESQQTLLNRIFTEHPEL